ncbi:hypothetical protein O181_004654 [Austropuccinia psidii MF-1]|uniref:Uncharacterized protein n=1 Tax=Austropuccinia psidii MF-1 TaxID=1389203 RepID=A0A9Q3BG72_9BASI|nr:hypothetical protein [Austropuccinia psidii MF-1]
MIGGLQSYPHAPRSLTTNFDVYYEPGLLKSIVLRDEPSPSGRHGDISVPVPKLFQSSQSERLKNIHKHLSGGPELLLPYQPFSESGEDHIALRRLVPHVFQGQIQEDQGFIEYPESSIGRPNKRT